MVSPNKIKVLIVDDEMDVLRALSFRFENFGFSVKTATNAKDALQTLKTIKHHIVVTDISMPEISGVELLKKIKDRDHLHPKVFIITGYSQYTLEECYHYGADGLFEKPFEAKDLASTIRRAFVDREQLWGTAPAVQSDHYIVKEYQSLSAAQKQHEFNIGRGGAFFADNQIKVEPGQIVAFDVKFVRGFLTGISGVGEVKWIRPQKKASLEAGFGMEFTYIGTENRKSLMVYQDSHKIVPYIPRR